MLEQVSQGCLAGGGVNPSWAHWAHGVSLGESQSLILGTLPDSQ